MFFLHRCATSILCLGFVLSASIAYAETSQAGPLPSAQFIAQVKARLAEQPGRASSSPSTLDRDALVIATQIIRSGHYPDGAIATSSATSSPTKAAPAASGLVNCFDYYRFGSVQADLAPSTPAPIAGSSISFSGSLTNTNPYPVVDGTLYVKIFRYTDHFDSKNGPDVVDAFAAVENISIPASSSIPASFSWKIPARAARGEYAAALYFVTDHKFNLLGLSFTDDVTGDIAHFHVGAEGAATVGFKKDAVTVDGASYHFAEFPPRTTKDAPIVIAAPLRNTTAADVEVSVRWDVYSWDAQDPKNLVATSLAFVRVPAKSSAPLSYTVTDHSSPVYLVVGTATWEGTKSIIGVRVVRPGVDQLRLNFPSTVAYPLQSGAKNTLFACFYNVADSVVENARLDLQLLDEKGREIQAFTYEGGVGSAMLAYATPFTPKRSYETYSINARLYQGDRLVDETTVHYDCKAIDPTSCPRDVPVMPIAAAAVAVVGVLGYFILRRRHTL